MSRMTSAVLVHLKGLPFSLCGSTYARIAARSWGMLVWEPRLSACSVRRPKKRYTGFSHEE